MDTYAKFCEVMQAIGKDTTLLTEARYDAMVLAKLTPRHMQFALVVLQESNIPFDEIVNYIKPSD